MNQKYVFFIPKGGLNDCFSQIQRVISYCNKYKRTLLLDMTNSYYNINFDDYFHIKNCGCVIIYDTNKIRDIIVNNKFSFYPTNLDFNLLDILDKKIKLNYSFKYNGIFVYKDIPLQLPNNNVNEDIILHSACGGGKGFKFLKNIFLKETIKSICNTKINLVKGEYLCIHVRNTDLKCNYQELYNNNKKLIHSYEYIYVCTDDKSVVDFFKSKKLNVFCFTTFPDIKGVNLHNSNIPYNIKIQDVFVDIFIATNSNKILSNSKGGFIKLLRDCFINKDIILDKLK